MKKSLLIAGSFLMLSGLFAQQQATMQVGKTNPKAIEHTKFDVQKFSANKGIKNSLRAGTEEYWLNYGISMDQYLGGGAGMTGPAVLNSNYLMPDSLCLGEFGTGNFAPVWLHHIGDILDVKSTVFNSIDGVTWDGTTAFRLDSMSVNYAYTRNDINPLVVDTLVVTLLNNATSANMPGYYYTGATATNYSTDTLSFKTLKYSYTSNTLNSTVSKTFKIPLTDADTAITFFREKMFAVPSSFNVPAGKLLGVDIMFKPGFLYNLGDTLDTQHNAFFFSSYEEQSGAFQTFFDCNAFAANCDNNSSQIVPQDVRYNTAGSWNGLFIPSYAYGATYSYEHHLISYKVVTPQTASIDEASNNNFALAQNQPNPFSNQTTINYQLKKSATNVSVQVYDITGAKVFEKVETNLKAGNYSVNLNNVHFTSGMYFYT